MDTQRKKEINRAEVLTQAFLVDLEFGPMTMMRS
jgi:hypothetical protein